MSETELYYSYTSNVGDRMKHKGRASPLTDAVLVQLYKMANSPNVVQTAIDVSSLLC